MKNFRLLFLAKRTMAVDSGRWRSGLASFILIGCAVFLPACNKTELPTAAEQEKSRRGVRTYRVKRQSLSAQVSYRGQVISLLDHELVCQLDGGGVVQSVVEEGIQVSRGEAVVIFNNSQIQDRLDQQKIVVQETEDALEEVTEKIGNSRIENTFQEKQFQDSIQLAELKIAQYVSEDYRREYEEIRERIILARQSMKKTEQGLEWAERVSQKGYITATELESFRLEMIKNETALESIISEEKLMKEFTFPRRKAKLELDVLVLKQRHNQSMKGFETDLQQYQLNKNTQQLIYEQAIEELGRLTQQMELCVLRSPVAGTVCYFTKEGPVQGSLVAGAKVNSLEPVVKISEQLMVQISLNHSIELERFRIGDSAEIRPVGRNSLIAEGKVYEVIPARWKLDPGTVHTDIEAAHVDTGTVLLQFQETPVKFPVSQPVTILLDMEIENALLIPEAAVMRDTDGSYCFLKTDKRLVRCKFDPGITLGDYVEVLDGIQEGDLLQWSVHTDPRKGVTSN